MIFLGGGGLSLSSEFISINPAYLITFLGVICSLVFIKNQKFNRIIAILYFVNLVYFFLSFLIFKDKQSCQFILGMLSLFCINNILKNKNILNIKKQINLVINIYIIYGICDIGYRFIKGGKEYFLGKTGNFYVVKMNSLMYSDSNFSGNIYVLMLALLLVLSTNLIENKRIKILLTCTLIMLTFSRAAIGVMIILIYIKFLSKIKNKSLKKLIKLANIIIGVIVLNIFLKLLNDKSFLARFEFIEKYIQKLDQINFFEILCGFGFTKSVDVLDGSFAHSIFLVLIIEKGILGLMLFLSLIVTIAIKYPKTRTVILAFLLSNSITTSYYYSLFFITIGILINLKRSNEDIKNNVCF
ncbi:hypothetical protein [Cetobacterium somerae]